MGIDDQQGGEIFNVQVLQQGVLGFHIHPHKTGLRHVFGQLLHGLDVEAAVAVGGRITDGHGVEVPSGSHAQRAALEDGLQATLTRRSLRGGRIGQGGAGHQGHGQQGFENFLIAVGYKGNMIEEFFGDGSEKGLHISYLREESSLGTAGALSLMTEAPQQTFIVMNGDVLNRIDLDALIETREQQKAIIAVAARESETLIPYGVIEDAAGKLVSMVEKPTLRHLINTGVYACSPDLLSHCPHNQPLSMVDLIDHLLLSKIDVAVYRTDAYWLDIGRLEELDRAQREWKSFSDD